MQWHPRVIVSVCVRVFVCEIKREKKEGKKVQMNAFVFVCVPVQTFICVKV